MSSFKIQINNILNKSKSSNQNPALFILIQDLLDELESYEQQIEQRRRNFQRIAAVAIELELEVERLQDTLIDIHRRSVDFEVSGELEKSPLKTGRAFNAFLDDVIPKALSASGMAKYPQRGRKQ